MMNSSDMKSDFNVSDNVSGLTQLENSRPWHIIQFWGLEFVDSCLRFQFKGSDTSFVQVYFVF